MKARNDWNCSDLGARTPAYVLSQQPQVKEEKKNQISVPGQVERKRHRLTPAKRNGQCQEKTKAEQIVIKITDEGFVTSHGDHFLITTAARFHLMPSLVKS